MGRGRGERMAAHTAHVRTHPGGGAEATNTSAKQLTHSPPNCVSWSKASFAVPPWQPPVPPHLCGLGVQSKMNCSDSSSSRPVRSAQCDSSVSVEAKAQQDPHWPWFFTYVVQGGREGGREGVKFDHKPLNIYIPSRSYHIRNHHKIVLTCKLYLVISYPFLFIISIYSQLEYFC